ncbi:FxsA family protein [Pelagibius litoralis]|uniref:FxsA family protein n=1 Tax=Pelagibius litoralis TaxID=374515 RepID=A0A967F2C4_9PROT|nr:FxsA family protein [Pelagibius litoralis]NIA71717.1 FxsA family protein [Pelagibius litoralis]
MALILLAVFIGLPLLEIAVFIQVGGALGIWPTIAATVATALAGSLLLRAQGLATLGRARAQMDRGQLPAHEMFEGICLVFAGALLLVPGFVTDAMGLLLFLPPFRAFLRRAVGRRLAQRAARGQARVFVDGQEVNPNTWGKDSHNKGRHGGPGGIIDGEFEELDDSPGDPNDSGKPKNKPGSGPGAENGPDAPRRLEP